LLKTELERRGWVDRPLVIRSSATDEDSAGVSFAGIHLSLLNVTGLEAIQKAIEAVWDSRTSARARAYRSRLGLGEETAGMAVILMPLLDAESAGILFTSDPLTGRRDRVIIHANWHLGESLVGGMTEGDVYAVGPDLLTDGPIPVEWTPGPKAVITCPRAGEMGTKTFPIPLSLIGQSVLSDGQARALAALARDAVDALDYTGGTDYDLEWVWDGRQFWLVQARPITTGAHWTYPALSHQPTYWTRGNSREVVPDPLSPIDWHFSQKMINRMLTHGYRLAGYTPLPGLRRGALFQGQLYLDATLIQWEGHDALGVDPKLMNDMLGGPQPVIPLPKEGIALRLARLIRMLRYLWATRGPRSRAETTLREAHRRTAEWRQADRTLPPERIARDLRKKIVTLLGSDDLLFLQASGGGALNTLGIILGKYMPGAGAALAETAMGDGPPSVTARQGHALVNLARVAQSDAPAWAWITAPDRNARAWDRALSPESPFRQAFARFLEDYGHRAIKETYLRSPRWREDPDYLLNLLPVLADQIPETRAEEQRVRATKARKTLVAALPFWAKGVVTGLLKQAKREMNDREAARSAMVAHLEVLRLDLLAIGAAFSGPGPDALDRAEAIFTLTLTEVFALAEGRLPPAAAARRIADRQPQLEAWAAIPEPLILVHRPNRRLQPEFGKVMHKQRSSAPVNEPFDCVGALEQRDGGRATALQEDPRRQNGTRLTGVGLSQGRATGRARIARDPTQALSLAEGDILVAPSTDPAWTPLFLKAGGLVMETGGVLSHGAIVAREFGIPAVANLSGVLDRLSDGDLITVDGTRGEVLIEE
jgi:pyruvate,water dikinase